MSYLGAKVAASVAHPTLVSGVASSTCKARGLLTPEGCVLAKAGVLLRRSGVGSAWRSVAEGWALVFGLIVWKGILCPVRGLTLGDGLSCRRVALERCLRLYGVEVGLQRSNLVRDGS